jgi:hypothetical protein
MLADARSRFAPAPLDTNPPRESGTQRNCADASADSVLESATLVVIDGERLGCRIAIGSTPLILGRGAGADFRIADPTVSRHHCVIWRASGRCWVRDLESTNRTRVNDRIASMAELFEGDVLIVGQTAMTLALGHETNAAHIPDDTPPC